MAWKLSFSTKAEKRFGKLDPKTRERVGHYLDHVLEQGDPYAFGKSLSGNLSRYWRYRVDKYRIICEIRDEELIIHVITLGKRDKIYQ